MSSASSESAAALPSGAGPNCQEQQLEELCGKVHRRLGTDAAKAIAVAEHASATRAMAAARNIVLEGEVRPSAGARTALLCSGVACLRRIHCDVETPENASLIRTTLVLLFTLLALCEESNGDVDDDEIVAAWQARPLEEAAFPEEVASTCCWSDELRSDARVGRAALRVARRVSGEGAMARLHELAKICFVCSSAAMARAALDSASPPDNDFLTLDAFSMTEAAAGSASKRLASLVAAAESEAGQSVFRDLVLSFKLPASVVGVRKALMLSRETNATATKSYTEILNAAHEAAMRGAEYEWTNSPDHVHLVCAVLAGLAVVLGKTPEAIRKSDAFAGRIALPFLQCTPPAEGLSRICLLADEWVCYELTNGKARVLKRGLGFEGFCDSILEFSSNLRK